MSELETIRNDQFYKRGLPHWQPIGETFFVTYRLFGSIPNSVIEQFKYQKEQMIENLSGTEKSDSDLLKLINKKAFFDLDKFLDNEVLKNDSVKWLSDDRIAKIVRDGLHYWNKKRYILHRYVIMFNHVHILIEPLKTSGELKSSSSFDTRTNSPCNNAAQYYKISKIVQSVKGFSAKKANEILGLKGPFWQKEYFDHWVRTEESFWKIVEYIDQNPVKAGLVKLPEDWGFSSAGEMLMEAQIENKVRV